MADQSQTVPSAFTCEGGLVLNKSTFIPRTGVYNSGSVDIRSV